MNYSTAILKAPAGWFKLVGSVPVPLADAKWDTEEEVIDALVNIGITKFQKADCSWYDPNGKTIADLSDKMICGNCGCEA